MKLLQVPPGRPGGKAILVVGTVDGETAFWVVNDLPLEAFKQSLDELLLKSSVEMN